MASIAYEYVAEDISSSWQAIAKNTFIDVVLPVGTADRRSSSVPRSACLNHGYFPDAEADVIGGDLKELITKRQEGRSSNVSTDSGDSEEEEESVGSGNIYPIGAATEFEVKMMAAERDRVLLELQAGLDASRATSRKVIPDVSASRASAANEVLEDYAAWLDRGHGVDAWDIGLATADLLVAHPERPCQSLREVEVITATEQNSAAWGLQESTMPAPWKKPKAEVAFAGPERPKLTSSAKAYLPAGNLRTKTPGAKLNKKARKLYGRLRWQCSHVAVAAHQAMLTCKFLTSVILDTTSKGNWSIVAHMPRESLHLKEQVLSVAKQTLLDACEQSDYCYVLGYKHRPFMKTSDGFFSLLAAVHTASEATCWSHVEYGCCAEGHACSWKHPALTINLTVTVKPDIV